MVKLSTFKEMVQKIEIDIEGEKISLKVRPYALRPEHEISGDPLALLDAFVEMVVEWDLLGEDGEPIPIDKEALTAQVPSYLTVLIFKKIRDKAIVLGK